MDTWADVDAAFEAVMDQRKKRQDNLTIVSTILIFSSTIWLIAPSIQPALQGKGGLIQALGLPLIVIIWALQVDEYVNGDAKGNTRAASAATIAWAPLLWIGLSPVITSQTPENILAALILVAISYVCFSYSNTILRGALNVLRYKAIMQFLGIAATASLYLPEQYQITTSGGILGASILLLATIHLIYTWTNGDEDRSLRREFRKRLDEVQDRMLEIKASGIKIDQANSLVMTASEEGHIDPQLGMRLLDDAIEDIERTLAFSNDIEEIQKDAELLVEESERIAPTSRRARKALTAGQREVQLGSLRDGELMFRSAKRSAQEIIEWWQKAESAITEAKRALDGKSGTMATNMREILNEAEAKMAKESAKKAFELAQVIPGQIATEDDAAKVAKEAIKEAKKAVKSADGIQKEMINQKLSLAEEMLEKNDPRQAQGLASSVVRFIESEREAMDAVNRALRQSSKLQKQWSERDDKENWDERWEKIESLADELDWSTAAARLNELTSDLDSANQSNEEAKELLEFIQEEWKIILNQCNASRIDAKDPDRMEGQESIAIAIDALAAGNIEQTIEALQIADSVIERIRRRL